MSLEDIIMKHEKIVMINDLHVPFEDKDTLNSVHRALKDIKPDRVIIGGDLVDFYSISHFDKDPSRRLSLQYEIEQIREYLELLRKAVPNAKIVYFMGNHEERLQKYIVRNAPELHWVEGLKIPRILGLDEFDIYWHDKRWYEYRGVIYSHLDKANKYGGYTSKNLGADFGKDVVHGHSHKTGNVRVGDTTFYDNGCLCELDAEYLSGPSLWSQAFMIIDQFGNKERHFTQVPIKNHRFVLNNKLYTPNGTVNLRQKKKK